MSEQTKDNLDDLNKAINPNAKDENKAEWEKTAKDGAKKAPEASAADDIAKKYAELEDKYKRLWADQQNMSNRFQREKQDIHKFAAAKTIEAILPALDNFEFAKKSINENTQIADVHKSIDMLAAQLMMSLQAVGLTEIQTNIPFNPELHEAISSVPDDTKEDGTILEVAKKGFKINDKVVRPASVVVSTKNK